MHLEGDFTVAAPAARLWDLLWDLEALANCVPGCEGAQQLDEKTYTGIVRARVGPIHARFNTRVTMLEVVPPHRITLRAEGQDDRTASQVRARVEMRLTPLGEASTRASYTAEVTIVGRLGQFGDGIIRETAALLLEQFSRNVQAHLEGSGDPSPPQELDLARLGGHALGRQLRAGAHHGLERLRRLTGLLRR